MKRITQYISDSIIDKKRTHILGVDCFFYFAFYKDSIKLCEVNKPIIGLKDYEIYDYNPLHSDCLDILFELIKLKK